MKKGLEGAAKKKARHDNPYTSVRMPVAGSTTLLLSCSKTLTLSSSRLVPALLFCSMLTALSSCPRLPTPSLSSLVPASFSRPMPTASSFVRTTMARSPLPTSVSHLEPPLLCRLGLYLF